LPLVIHFLNVGHGDCTLVEFPSGRLAMIDINNSKSLPEKDKDGMLESLGLSPTQIILAKALGTAKGSLDRYEALLVDPVDYYMSNFSKESIFRYIQTHPDMDHMSGLNRLSYQEAIPIVNFWDIDHDKDFNENDFEGSPYSYLDWLVYKLLRSGRQGNGEDVTVLRLTRGVTGQYYQEDGISILGPTSEMLKKASKVDNYNIASYVLRIEYGSCRIILGGDAETETWEDIYLSYQDDYLRASLLKAAHHGRKSGYYQPVVKSISPRYTIVSVGKKPETDASHLYSQYSEVFSTRYHGTITAKCWLDGDVWLYDSKGDRLGG